MSSGVDFFLRTPNLWLPQGFWEVLSEQDDVLQKRKALPNAFWLIVSDEG